MRNPKRERFLRNQDTFLDNPTINRDYLLVQVSHSMPQPSCQSVRDSLVGVEGLELVKIERLIQLNGMDRFEVTLIEGY